MAKTDLKNQIPLTNVIRTAIQLPGVKIDRSAFLREQFKSAPPDILEEIIEKGPIEAHCSQEELQKLAKRLVQKRTMASSAASFAAGIPGGFALAATIPADTLQFYGVALGLAQEIAYLYGEGDLWANGVPDDEKITNQLILYCGTMFGASGAAQMVRILASNLAEQALAAIPQKALMHTIYYPLIKSIAKAFGVQMTKEGFARGVAKVVPLIGGAVSGSITYATMRPMGLRLANAFEEALFSYSQADFEADWSEIIEVCESEIDSDAETIHLIAAEHAPSTNAILEKIQKAKELLDTGAISDKEFAEIKAKLIAQL